jgi:hypothetical protein
MSAVLTTIAAAATTATASSTIDLTAADAFAGFIALIVGILSFLAISGLALSMTIGASKSPGTLAITGITGVLSVLIAIGLYNSLSVKHPDMSVLFSKVGADRFGQMSLSERQSALLDMCPAGLWDRLGGVIALVVGITTFLALAGIVGTGLLAAFSSNKSSSVSSWPVEQEQSFFGFDRRIAAAQSRAWASAVAAGVLVFLFVFGVYQGVEPDKRDITKDMNMSNITKKGKADAAPKQAAPKAEPQKQEAPPAEAPKTEAPKTEAPKAEKAK